MKILLHLILGAAVLAPTAALSDAESPLSGGVTVGGLQLAGSEDPAFRKTYIVQLVAPPAAERVATMRRSTARFAAGDGTRQRFDKNSAMARSIAAELQAEQDIVSSELETLLAMLQARKDQPPPPPPAPVETEDELASRLVTFRFLGLKTDKTRLLLLIDMNKYLAEHRTLVWKSVSRALDSLQPGYEFGILGFQQLDSGPRYHRWPEDGGLAAMNHKNQAEALRFVGQMSKKFEGASSLQAAIRLAFESPAEAIILFSDGLPNPDFNGGLPPRALIQDISLANTKRTEIHAVTIGDYFKYKGTVEFMESLARANSGGFLALAQ